MKACTSQLRSAGGTAWARARRLRRNSAPGSGSGGQTALGGGGGGGAAAGAGGLDAMALCWRARLAAGRLLERFWQGLGEPRLGAHTEVQCRPRSALGATERAAGSSWLQRATMAATSPPPGRCGAFRCERRLFVLYWCPPFVLLRLHESMGRPKGTASLGWAVPAAAASIPIRRWLLLPADTLLDAALLEIVRHHGAGLQAGL